MDIDDLETLLYGDYLIWSPPASMYRPNPDSSALIKGGETIVMVTGYPVYEGEGACFQPYIPVQLAGGMTYTDHVTLEEGDTVHAKHYELRRQYP